MALVSRFKWCPLCKVFWHITSIHVHSLFSNFCWKKGALCLDKSPGFVNILWDKIFIKPTCQWDEWTLDFHGQKQSHFVLSILSELSYTNTQWCFIKAVKTDNARATNLFSDKWSKTFSFVKVFCWANQKCWGKKKTRIQFVLSVYIATKGSTLWILTTEERAQSWRYSQLTSTCVNPSRKWSSLLNMTVT